MIWTSIWTYCFRQRCQPTAHCKLWLFLYSKVGNSNWVDGFIFITRKRKSNDYYFYLTMIIFLFFCVCFEYICNRMHRPDHLARSDSARRRLYQLFRQDSPLVQRFAQTYPDEVYPNRSGTQWRQYIYNRRLYAEPLNDLSGQSRNISAEFYR